MTVMQDSLRTQIKQYLPDMMPGSTFLDAGCHEGTMYQILMNEMRLDIRYHGIDDRQEFIMKARERYGDFFECAHFLDYHTKFDYVWCSQMTFDDNSTYFRHLAGLAKRWIYYSHIPPQQNHENVKPAVKLFTDDRFRIYIA